MDSIEYSQAVSARINALRQSAGLSILTLSEKSGVPRTTLDRKLNGHADFSVREVKAIAEALGTSALELTTVYTASIAA